MKNIAVLFHGKLRDKELELVIILSIHFLYKGPCIIKTDFIYNYKHIIIVEI
jgi:hypothetical protein